CREVPQTNVFQREMKGTERCSSQMFVMSEFTEVDLTSQHPHEAAYSMLVLAALRRGCRSHHAAEADMAGRGVDRLGMARRRTIAPAIVGRAEMGAAFQHLARD